MSQSDARREQRRDLDFSIDLADPWTLLSEWIALGWWALDLVVSAEYAKELQALLDDCEFAEYLADPNRVLAPETFTL